MVIQFATSCAVLAQVNRMERRAYAGQNLRAAVAWAPFHPSREPRLTTLNTGLRFAVFANDSRAREAQSEVAGVDDVALLTGPSDLRTNTVRGDLTIVRLALLLSASIAVGFVVVGIGTLILMAAQAVPSPVPAAYVTTGVAVVLAAGLGGLAGAVAYAGRSRTKLARLRGLLDHGHSVLLFRAQGEFDEILRRCGAVQIGTLT